MKRSLKWILPGAVVAIFLALMIGDIVQTLRPKSPRLVNLLVGSRYDFIPEELYLDFREDGRYQGEDLLGPWQGVSLREGWSRFTRGGIWGMDKRSLLEVHLLRDDHGVLALDCRPFPGLPEGSQQTIEVRINGVSCAPLDLQEKAAMYRLQIPRGALKVGRNEIEFLYAHHLSPREASGKKDARQLAVNFRRLAIVRDETRSLKMGAWSNPVEVDGQAITVRGAGRLILPFRLAEPAATLRFTYAFRGLGSDGEARLEASVARLQGDDLETIERLEISSADARIGPSKLALQRSTGELALVCDLRGDPRGLGLRISNPQVVMQVKKDRRPTRSRQAPPLPSKMVDDPPDVVLIILDALRTDHTGATFGYARDTAPEVDRIAGSSLVFTNVRAQASYTSCSVPTMMTGMSFASHNVVDKNDRLHEAETTLAESLAQAGYRTLGISATPNNSRRLGFAQGFDEFHETWQGVPWLKAIDPFLMASKVEKRLAQGFGDDPLFLMLHFVPPHSPYMPGAAFHRWGDPQYSGPCDGSEEYLNGIYRFQIVPDADDIRELVALYDGNISMVDRALARVIRALVRRGRASNTLLIITSDHGEAFFEHGKQGHNSTVYDEMLRVPLLLRMPGGEIPAGVDVHREVSLEDLVPTILGVVGLEVGERVSGVDLLAGEPSAQPGRQRQLFRSAPNPDVIGLRQGRFKVIANRPGRVRELYDLQEDPEERHNLATERPTLMSLMIRALLDEVEAAPRPFAATGEALVSEDDRKALEALGYAR